MYFFDVLGIEPTADIKTIKKAYAKLAAKHHPEDDEEMFMRIHNAYKSAMKYAQTSEGRPHDGIIMPGSYRSTDVIDFFELEAAADTATAEGDENVFDLSNLEAAPQMMSDETDSVFDFRILQEDAEKEALSNKLKKQSQKNEMDFINSAQILFEKLQETYSDSVKKNTSGAWRDIFESAEFENEIKNPMFVSWVLEYLIHHRNVSAHIWNGIVIPALKKIKKLYPKNADIQNKVIRLSITAKEKDSLSKEKILEKIFSIAILTVLVLWVIFNFEDTNLLTRVSPTPSPNVFSYKSDLPELGIESIVKSNVIVTWLENGEEYDLVEEYSNGKITEENYKKLNDLYKREGKQSLTIAIYGIMGSEYMVSEFAGVENPFLLNPHMLSALCKIGGEYSIVKEGSEGRITEEGYEELCDLYEREGAIALDVVVHAIISPEVIISEYEKYTETNKSGFSNASILSLLCRVRGEYSIVKEYSKGKITEEYYEELCDLYKREGVIAHKEAVFDVMGIYFEDFESSENDDGGN